MTKDELLKPRYKVIADYPGSHFKEGNILLQFKGRYEFWSTTDINPMDEIYHPEEYPHLFKRLEWWEERKPEEMPEYILEEGDQVLKATWKDDRLFIENRTPYRVTNSIMCFFKPSTESEYLYQQTK